MGTFGRVMPAWCPSAGTFIGSTGPAARQPRRVLDTRGRGRREAQVWRYSESGLRGNDQVSLVDLDDVDDGALRDGLTVG